QHAVDHAGDQKALFIVVHPGVDAVQRKGIVEGATRRFKGDSMFSEIALCLCLVPFELDHGCTVCPYFLQAGIFRRAEEARIRGMTPMPSEEARRRAPRGIP